MMKILPRLALAITLVSSVTGCSNDERPSANKTIATNPAINTKSQVAIGHEPNLDSAPKETRSNPSPAHISKTECHRIRSQISSFIKELNKQTKPIACKQNSDCREWVAPASCNAYFGAISDQDKDQLRQLYASWRQGSCFAQTQLRRPNCGLIAIRVATGNNVPVCVDEQCVWTRGRTPAYSLIQSIKTQAQLQFTCPQGSRLTGESPPKGFQLSCELPDGTKHGKWILWFPGGLKKEEGEYQDGKRVGTWTSWYRSGQKKSEGQYKDDKKMSVWTCWDKKDIAYTCPLD